MNIIKKTGKFSRVLRFFTWTKEDSRKAGIDSRYASEQQVECTVTLKAWNELIDKTLVIQLKLDAAAYALSLIEARTSENARLGCVAWVPLHKIAFDAYGAAKQK